MLFVRISELQMHQLVSWSARYFKRRKWRGSWLGFTSCWEVRAGFGPFGGCRRRCQLGAKRLQMIHLDSHPDLWNVVYATLWAPSEAETTIEKRADRLHNGAPFKPRKVDRNNLDRVLDPPARLRRPFEGNQLDASSFGRSTWGW